MSKHPAKQKTLFQAWQRELSSGNASHSSQKSRKRCGKTLTANEAVDMLSDPIDLTDDDLVEAAEMLESTMNCAPGTSGISNKPIEHIPGFDNSLGNIWIYPTNYPVRDYQFSIVRNALFKNTLVSLPTGLGKTFIAAVVMYNFYRWYPQGKIVFMAPTKPLVSQQIEACYKIMGIPLEDQAEITGMTTSVHKREALWSSKRVFFLTPQVINNDLARGVCPASHIKCIVIDEAHKAQGKHAYCQVVNQLAQNSREFRVLALSATPGTDVKSVQMVISNLLISHIEIRSEDSIDIQSFSHQRKVEKIVCKLDETMINMKNNYLKVIEIFTKSLVHRRALFDRETSSYSKYGLLMARDQFRKDPPSGLNKYEIGSVEGDFATCISLFHGLELLQQHGMRSFFIFLKAMMEGEKGNMRAKSVLGANTTFCDMYKDLLNLFGESPNSTVLLTQAGQTQQSFKQGNCSSQTTNYVYSHPKIKKLEEVVLTHFKNFKQSHDNDTTRVMVFCQYRDSVQEITELLQKHRPIVRPMQFVGHSTASGKVAKFTQKDQLMVVSKFRDGGYNTLISTCVGEEGLDIGDVDLIVCFDAHKSPIRLVQRMGRTGRKRKGRIIMLVTEGKEERDYNSSLSNKKSIQKAITGNSGRSLQFYQHSPRMIPRGLDPKPFKMFIKIHEKTENQAATKGNKKKVMKKTENADISVLMKNVENQNSVFLNHDQVREWDEKLKLSVKEKEKLKILPDTGRMMCLGETRHLNIKSPARKQSQLSLSEWTIWQTRLQSSNLSGHSTSTTNFVEIMEICDLVKESDEKSFEENFAPFLGGKYNRLKMDADRKTKIDSFLVPKEKPLKKVKESKKLTDKIKNILKHDELSPELSADTDFVTEVPKKIFPQKNFRNKLAGFACEDDNFVRVHNPTAKDDTLNGIDSILHDRECSSFTQNNVCEQNNGTSSVVEDDEMECLPDFDMGGWGSVDDSDHENKDECDGADDSMMPFEVRKEKNSAETESLVKSEIVNNGAEDAVESSHCEKNSALLDIVDNISAIPTQTPIVTSKNINCTSNMKPPTPPSFGSISLDFLDDFDFDGNETAEKGAKPKKRACFDIGDEDDSSKNQSKNIVTGIVNDNYKMKKVVSDTLNQPRNGASEESTSQNCGSDIVYAKQAKTPSRIDEEVAVSLDASADMFDVDFDLGGFDDESFDCKNSQAGSPVLTNKTASSKANENRDFNDEGHSSLAYVTLTQRVENRALFADFPKCQSDVNIPVAEVKPQRSSSFCTTERGTNQSKSVEEVPTPSVCVTAESVFPSSSSKRKRSTDNDASLLKRTKHKDPGIFARPVQVVISRSEILQTPKLGISSTDSDESPILARKKRNLNNKQIFSPETDLSQKTANSDKNERNFLMRTSNVLPNKKVLKFHTDESPISFPHKHVETSARNKHSTPKCVPRDFEQHEFSDEEDDFSYVHNRRKLEKNPKNIRSKKSLHSGKMQRRRRLADFVEDEAEVSDDGVQVSSDEIESCDSGALEEMREFVNDATQLTQHVGQNESTVDEQAMYLQHKSDFFGEPAKFEGHNGRFKLAYGIGESIDVFSQEVPSDVSGYAEDSFVCDDEIGNEADDITALGEVTLLEVVTNTSIPKQRITRRQAELNRLKKLNYEASPVLPAVSKLKKQTKIVDKSKRKRIICMDESADSIAESLNETKRNDRSITWECSVCTLLNKEGSQICELCDSEKPTSDDPNKEMQHPKTWTCKTCTYKNQGHLQKCDMCGEIFVSSSMDQKKLENASNTRQKKKVEKNIIENNAKFFTTKNLTPIKSMEVDIESDIISATPVSIQNKHVGSKKSSSGSTLSSSAAGKNNDAKFRVPTPRSSQMSLSSSYSSSVNEEREERLRRCREKQVEFRARMEKRKSLQSSSEDTRKSAEPLASMKSGNISKMTPDRKTQHLLSSIKTSLQFNSPSTSDVINSSITSPIVQKSKDKESKNVIFVDSKELSSCQPIITTLRSKHDIHVVVASLPHCDYIVGRGTAVERKMVSDFSQVSNRQKLVARFQQLNISYDRVYLIIEQDRVKKGDMSTARPTHSSYYVSSVCALSQTSLRILYSDNQEETAGLLHVLSAREKNLKRSIESDVAEKATDIKYRSALRLYSSIPKVSFVSALYMCKSFNNVKEVACSSVEKLMHKAHLSTCAAAEVYSYFRRNFDLQMTPSR